jgi:UDP-N-acetylglucosamine 2-epimerase (non-hydrolysing)
LRENTERPITITLGTNVLIGRDWGLLEKHFHEALTGGRKETRHLPLWDGKASERIAEILTQRGLGAASLASAPQGEVGR